MKKLLAASLAFLFLSRPAPAAQAPPSGEQPSKAVKIRAKDDPRASGGGAQGLLEPDVDIIDAPTTAVLDYGGYSARSRFFSNGGLLQYASFGVFQGLNIGASLNIDGIIGSDTTVRVREPNAQVKYRFYEGDRNFPSFAVGFDGQGFLFNQPEKRYNQRKRGFFVVASQELGLRGLQVHPSFNISDTNTNSFFGAIPLSYNIQDKVSLMLEWDNINDFHDSRLNSGLRVYMTPRFHLDFAVRGIGQGGRFTDGNARGPERIVQLKYSAAF